MRALLTFASFSILLTQAVTAQQAEYKIEHQVLDIGIGLGYLVVDGRMESGVVAPIRLLIHTQQRKRSGKSEKARLLPELIGSIGLDYSYVPRFEEVSTSRYYWDRLSNGQSRCRDSQTGRFASNSLCNGLVSSDVNLFTPNASIAVGFPLRRSPSVDEAGKQAIVTTSKEQRSLLFLGTGIRYNERIRPYLSAMLPLFDFRNSVTDYTGMGMNLWGEVGDGYMMAAISMNFQF